MKIVAGNLFLCVCQHLIKPLVIKWFEEVIHGVDLKSAERILIVGGNEDDLWQLGYLKLLDHFEDNKYLFIVLEYMRGGDMYDYLNKRDFSVSEERALELAT